MLSISLVLPTNAASATRTSPDISDISLRSFVSTIDIWEGECYATHWLEDNTFTSDFSDTRYHNDDKVTMHNGEVWSKDEFHDNGQMIGDKNWPNDAAEAELERRAAAADPTQASMELWS